MRQFEDRLGAWLASIDVQELESASLPSMDDESIKLTLGKPATGIGVKQGG